MSRGQVVLVRLHAGGGERSPQGEYGGTRPCIIVQHDGGNRTSPTTIVVIVRERTDKNLPFLVPINKDEGGLERNSLADCSHILTIGKSRIVRTLGTLSPSTVRMIDHALVLALDLHHRPPPPRNRTV